MSSSNASENFFSEKENCDVANDEKSLESTKHTCSDCGSVILDLDKHPEVCSGVKRYTCIDQDCVASFTTRQKLREHSRTVHEAPIACPYDNCEHYVKLIDLAHHVEMMHQSAGELNILNENCEKKITDPNQCLSKPIGHNSKKYPCEFKDCTLFFVTKLDLALHLHDEHKAPLRCAYQQCAEEFVSLSGLDIHIKTAHRHAIRKICENCGKDVQRRWLNKHIARCTNSLKVRAFKCTVKDCKSSFVYKEDLDVHTRTVHIAPIFCQSCGKLKSAQNFTSHFRRCTSNGEKRFLCPAKGCKAAFTTFMGKNAHVRLIHKEPIKCPFKLCKKFVKPYRLGLHMKAAHGESKSKKQKKSKKRDSLVIDDDILIDP